jgi:hypothetical protein
VPDLSRPFIFFIHFITHKSKIMSSPTKPNPMEMEEQEDEEQEEDSKTLAKGRKEGNELPCKKNSNVPRPRQVPKKVPATKPNGAVAIGMRLAMRMSTFI